MPKPLSEEFRDDNVVAVARKGDAPLIQIATDFGISEGCLHGWMKKADVDDGTRPGVTTKDAGELREAKKVDPVARAGERGPAPGRRLPVPGEPVGK